jgi:putative glycosyltransferase (TIGR04372 family)
MTASLSALSSERLIARLIQAAGRHRRTRYGRLAMRLLMRTTALRPILFWIAARADGTVRRSFIDHCQRENPGPAKREFAEAARRAYERNAGSSAYLHCYALALTYSADAPAAWSLTTSARVRDALADEETAGDFFALAVDLGFELARYRDAVRIAHDAVRRYPDALRPRYDYLKAAFAAGKLRDERAAMEFFGRQFNLIKDSSVLPTDAEIERVIVTFQEQTIHTISPTLLFQWLSLERMPRIGVFFLSATEALGHAVLDPYYFVAMNRDKFDSLIFIGPPKSSYRPASRACLEIVEQYGEYVETGSDILMNLSWMSLGHHGVGPVTSLVDHYWMLLRQAVHRSRDAADPFRHNAWHFVLPAEFTRLGEQFCTTAGISLDRPIVVLHVRDPGYHGIVKQSYRDATVANYRAAIHHLLDCGYQVVRVGDQAMPRLELGRSGYFELPFIPKYRNELDPFLISRARFMIGSQSGPCAFARVLDVPILTVNAVLHYTLLPSTREMACFKRYYRARSGERRELPLEAAIDAHVFHFENSFQFDEAGIVLEEASSEEIVASVGDMIAWLDDPQLAETELQTRFATRVEAMAVELKERGERLELPIADYLGICLPGYRISPTVATMRERSARAAATQELVSVRADA